MGKGIGKGTETKGARSVGSPEKFPSEEGGGALGIIKVSAGARLGAGKRSRESSSKGEGESRVQKGSSPYLRKEKGQTPGAKRSKRLK